MTERPSRSGSIVRELPTVVVVLVTLAAAVVVGAGMRALGSVLGPAFLALVLVLAVDPVRTAAVRRGLPGWAAVGLAVACAYAVLAILIGGLLLSVTQLLAVLPGYTPRFEDVVSEIATILQPYGITREQLADLVTGVDPSSVSGALRSFLSGATSVGSALLLLVVLILFLVAEASQMVRLVAAPPLSVGLVAALRQFVHRTRQYLVVSTVFGLVVAVADAAVLVVLGIPAPWVWGLLAFVTNYVPNVGFVLGVVPPAVIALLQDGPGGLLAVVVAYSVLNVVIQYVVQPKVVGEVVRLSPTVTLLSLVVWTIVIGPLGGLLAVPLTLFAKAVLVDADPGARWLSGWLGDPAPDPPG